MAQWAPSLFTIITTDCNLHCCSCLHGCDVLREPYYYITPEEFRKQLTLVKENNNTISNSYTFDVCLTGGDAFCHPQLKELCAIARELFPKNQINVSTNGILVDTLTDEDLNYYIKTLNVHIMISIYPRLSLLDMYLRIKKRFEKIHAEGQLDWNETHLFFNKQTILTNPTEQELKTVKEGYERNCKNRILNETNLVCHFKDKTFYCWNQLSNLHHSTLYNMDDYPNAYDIKPNQDLIDSIYCQSCEGCAGGYSAGDEWILWHTSDEIGMDISYYSLKHLYVYNYDVYYKLVHDCKEMLECLKNDFFKQYIDPNHNIVEETLYEHRFVNGKLDIYIPINDLTNIDNFYECLSKQTLLNQCNLYFVDLTQNTEIQLSLYEKFNPNKQKIWLNSYFLKADNLYSGYKSFENNSYRPQKILLDINDNQLANPKYLEQEWQKKNNVQIELN